MTIENAWLRMVYEVLRSLTVIRLNAFARATVFSVSISEKERLGANQSAEIRTEAQHCVPLRMNPIFSHAAFHIRPIHDVLSISAADVNSL